ncbi:MAG TPA: hypothetical protein VN578_13895 [Candidatus Binatia bacterium]|jgi:hypothetical protein|nr:hypothetical protein [Candidatus Binatia bacterium]
MNAAARRYVLLALGLAVGLAGGLALLNYLVDPYNRFGLNRLGVYISADREFKATEVRRYPHNALLVGNSRMGVVQPEQLNGFRFFNGAFAGATAEEAYYFIAHFARTQELVILSVDPGAGDPAELKGDIFGPASCTAILNNLFNLQTVEYSFRTISEHLAGIPDPMRADGSTDMAFWLKTADQDRPAYRDWQLELLKRGYATSLTNVTKAGMSSYKRIRQCLQERRILCVVWVPPLHEAIAQHLQTQPAVAAAYQHWKQELKAIFPYVVDLSGSSYCAHENFFGSDPAHFRAEAGARMLNAEVIPAALRMLREGTNTVKHVLRGADGTERGPSPPAPARRTARSGADEGRFFPAG